MSFFDDFMDWATSLPFPLYMIVMGAVSPLLFIVFAGLILIGMAISMGIPILLAMWLLELMP